MMIGFDGSRAFKADKTGTETYSYQLLTALAKLDKKHQYIVYIRPGVEVGRWPENFHFKTINFSRWWTQVGLAAKTFTDSLDLLFIPAHTLPIIRKPGLKTVITVHDLGSEYLPAMHQVKQRLYLSFMQKFQLKTASKIIAVSKATKQDLINRIGIEPNKITVIYEGYDEKLFRPIKSLSRAKSRDDILVNSLRQYGLDRDKYFVFVGTVQPRKNLARLIEAFALLGGKLRLVIAGQKGWLSDEIYLLPKKLGIEARVKFLGYVPEKDLPALYSQALALVFPSLFEGFGLPILEAQACGCPVITSKVSSMPEVAGKGAVYVNPYSIEDIIRGLKEIRQSKDKLIKAGFENVNRFSWQKCARETLQVLESL